MQIFTYTKLLRLEEGKTVELPGSIAAEHFDAAHAAAMNALSEAERAVFVGLVVNPVGRPIQQPTERPRQQVAELLAVE